MNHPDIEIIHFSHKDYCGRTPLMVACMTGNEVAVRTLVTQPEIDLETRDNEGEWGGGFCFD